MVAQEEAVVNEKAEYSEAIKVDCEADLGMAMPMLNRALKALNTVTRAGFFPLRSIGVFSVFFSRWDHGLLSYRWVHLSASVTLYTHIVHKCMMHK